MPPVRQAGAPRMSLKEKALSDGNPVGNVSTRWYGIDIRKGFCLEEAMLLCLSDLWFFARRPRLWRMTDDTGSSDVIRGRVALIPFPAMLLRRWQKLINVELLCQCHTRGGGEARRVGT